MIGSGWTFDGINFAGGLLRMMFPFTFGMLLSRKFRPVKIKGAFWICSLVLVVLFCVPYIEGKSPVCLNGVYEMFCIAIVFPVLVWLGASGKTTDRTSSAVCKFLGDISYPLYAIHYPIMYLFYSWLIKNNVFTMAETWHVAVPVYFGNIALAYILLKVYDEPVRKFLSRKFINKKKNA